MAKKTPTHNPVEMFERLLMVVLAIALIICVVIFVRRSNQSLSPIDERNGINEEFEVQGEQYE